MPFEPITDIDYEAGLVLGRERLAGAVVATAVRHDPAADRVIVSLGTCDVSIPRTAIDELIEVPAADLGRLRLSAVGDAIAVDGGDVQIDIAGLLGDVLPATLLVAPPDRRRGTGASVAASPEGRVRLPDRRARSSRPALARSLNNLGVLLANLGRSEEALQAMGEAVALYRELAAVRSDAFRPDLASSLDDLAKVLGDVGRADEAVAIAREAVGIHRELAAAA